MQQEVGVRRGEGALHPKSSYKKEEGENIKKVLLFWRNRLRRKKAKTALVWAEVWGQGEGSKRGLVSLLRELTIKRRKEWFCEKWSDHLALGKGGSRQNPQIAGQKSNPFLKKKKRIGRGTGTQCDLWKEVQKVGGNAGAPALGAAPPSITGQQEGPSGEGGKTLWEKKKKKKN